MRRIIMLGWEWPPLNTGGLGVASQGIATYLARQGFDVIFVLPRKIPIEEQKNLHFIFLDDLQKNDFSHGLNPASLINAYPSLFFQNTEGKSIRVLSEGTRSDATIFATIQWYCQLVKSIVNRVGDFDYIYHHDWLTYLPAKAIKRLTGKPLVSHVHATTHDIGAFLYADSRVEQIEQEMISEADMVITVSAYEKNILLKKYDGAEDKIFVAHNALLPLVSHEMIKHPIAHFKNKRIVLFVGRLTNQKGGEFFIKAVPLVLKYIPDAFFVIAGSGYEQGHLMTLSHSLGVASRVSFTGFVQQPELNRLYHSAEVFVMPSVSEPFGLVALEAARFGVPLIISKNSGVKEVLKNVFQTDFWDVNGMANKIVGLLRHKPLQTLMSNRTRSDAQKNSWENTALTISNALHSLS